MFAVVIGNSIAKSYAIARGKVNLFSKLGPELFASKPIASY
jgi:hypothetical protein